MNHPLSIPARPSRSENKAFTLVELLVVVSIMAILMTLAVPALSSMVENNNLARGGQVIADQINLARQMASARNTAVEVRLFKLPKQSDKGYNAVQLWAGDAAGNRKPASRMSVLPPGIVLSENLAVSEALAQMPSGSMPADGGAAANASYAYFQIRPSGVTVPAVAMADAYLTVVPSRFATESEPPKNYVTIQINPLTATPLVYRP